MRLKFFEHPRSQQRSIVIQSFSSHGAHQANAVVQRQHQLSQRSYRIGVAAGPDKVESFPEGVALPYSRFVTIRNLPQAVRPST